MINATDARYLKAEHAICDALARLLEDKPLDAISMSEIAREANVSRSTLYAHFQNVMEAYRATVARFYERTQDLAEHFACTMCRNGQAVRPFCDRLRNAADYRGVVKDGHFLGAALDTRHATVSNTLIERLEAVGLDTDVAEAVFRFQMSGCYAVAVSECGRQGDWPRYQETLDRFIRGGLQALGVQM